jgi:DNA-binding MarR family transcriptional regulator
MEHRDEIGFQVRTLSNLIRRMVDQRAFPKGEKVPTGMHGWIMGYLYEHRDQDVFQRDIQEQFSIRRSTVTGVLQLMEKNGLITRTGVDSDARLKKLQLTPKAIELHQRVESSIHKVEAVLSSGLTPEEKEQFLLLCEKIRHNAEQYKD